MSQYDIIIKAMITNPEKQIWIASDFQKEPYFVGYEASARMSELKDMFEDLFIVGKKGRFRTLSINWNYEGIEELKEKCLEK